MPRTERQRVYDMHKETAEFLDNVTVKYLDGVDWTLEPITDRFGNGMSDHESRHDPFNTVNRYQR